MKSDVPLRDVIGKKVLLLDGAMGSMLIAAGMKEGIIPELWNLEKPDLIKNIHLRYYEAGSDIVQTNTFGANRIKLQASKKDDHAEEINAAAARHARDVCPAGCFVAGDIGPTGQFMRPVGGYEFDQFRDAFAEQASYLADAGVDLFHVETMYDLNEALAALKGIRAVSSQPVFVSITFRKTPRGFFTFMGNQPLTALTQLAEEGAAVTGSNCTLTSAEMYELVKEIRSEFSGPLVIQPNAGQPVLKDGAVHYPETPEVFRDNVKKILSLDVQVIGGCCGTTPETIKLLRELIDNGTAVNSK
jgi:methionine synthase I (cobalamin-dependent)